MTEQKSRLHQETEQISITDLAVGQRVWISAQNARWPRSWITFTDHRVLQVQLYTDGSVAGLLLEAWEQNSAKPEVVERRHLLDVRLYKDQRTPQQRHRKVSYGPAV